MSQCFESLLLEAVNFSLSHEVKWSRDTQDPWGIHKDDPSPWDKLFGPVFPRGGVSGVISRKGSVLARWGESDRADMTFSVAKTYLSLICGVAYDQGLIKDIDQPISDMFSGIGFDRGPNRLVTWRHLLQQTSEWEGVCCDIPDEVDHHRYLSFQNSRAKPAVQKGVKRKLNKPGTYWEYNDVRINQLSLALSYTFRESLDTVFERAILAPIGCSLNWSWSPYEDCFISIDGKRIPILPGGSHWGGGIRISSEDQVLVGQLIANKGMWEGDQLISQGWFDQMLAPSKLAPFYGFLVWLNTDNTIFPSIPESSFFAIGAGGAYTWIDPELQSVTVVRWIDPQCADQFMAKVRHALMRDIGVGNSTI